MDIGVTYYPEQWPEERWKADVDLMAEAGISFVRMGEFAWHRIESEKGKYSFRWLEEAMDIFGDRGINTILGTPTACYPSWLHAEYPDIHQIDFDGRIKEFGQRQDACRNHPGFKKAALRITDAMTAALGSHPHLIAWQTDNELGNHGSVFCTCSHCEASFRGWLKDKYADIDALNEAWGTAVWSQTYNAFEEVDMPRDTADNRRMKGHNPGRVLDYRRFASDSIINYHKQLAAIIRKNSPDRIVTHNFMNGFTGFDAFSMASDLDVVSWDNYPIYTLVNGEGIPPASSFRFMQGLKKADYWVMEQMTGQGGWEIMLPRQAPGTMRLWAWQTAAMDCSGICFFRWRSALRGTEQFWHGILPHDGKPGRLYQELKKFIGEADRITPVLEGSSLKSKAVVLYDFDSIWALQHQPQAESDFSYESLSGRIVEALRLEGLSADIRAYGEDLSDYEIAFLPSLFVADREPPEEITRFVEKGGTLVVGARSGVKDRTNAVTEKPLPGVFRDLAGVSVSEYDNMDARGAGSVRVSGSGLSSAPVFGMGDILTPDAESDILLEWEGAWYSGRPAATSARRGRGRCVYLGAVLDPADLARFLIGTGIIAEAPWHPPEGVETILRVGKEARHRLYLNHKGGEIRVKTPFSGYNLISEEPVEKEIVLESYGVAIIREEF